MAALRKRLSAVCPENSNFNGWLKDVASLLSDSNYTVKAMSMSMSISVGWLDCRKIAGRCAKLRTGTGLLGVGDKFKMQILISVGN
jgi:hypothetical protein